MVQGGGYGGGLLGDSQRDGFASNADLVQQSPISRLKNGTLSVAVSMAQQRCSKKQERTEVQAAENRSLLKHELITNCTVHSCSLYVDRYVHVVLYCILKFTNINNSTFFGLFLVVIAEPL